MWVLALFLLCHIYISQAQFDPIEYTGTILPSSPTFRPPTWEGSDCFSNTSTYAYKWFPLNFTQSGVWHIIASAEAAIQDKLQVYIYISFDPALSCNSLLLQRPLSRQPLTLTASGPIVNDFVYLHHPNYVFVIAAPSGMNGTFGINILPALKSGTTVGSPLWPIVVSNAGVCEAYTTSLSTPFAYYTWTQASSGIYDIYIMFDGSETSWYSFIALYNSGLTWQQLQTPCNTSGAGKYLQATSNAVEARGAGIWYQSLKGRVNYTIAFSGYGSSQVGFYGIRIVPTQVRMPFQSAFVQPQRDISQCYSDPYNDDSSWDAIFFTAQYPAYLIDTGEVAPPLMWFDTYSFLYSGENIGPPPVGCPYFAQLLTQADTGDAPLAQLTTVGANYTAVISTFSGEQTGTSLDYAYMLYVITGDYIPDDQAAHPSASSCSLVFPSSIYVYLLFIFIISKSVWV